jgi:hypothetical protein
MNRLSTGKDPDPEMVNGEIFRVQDGKDKLSKGMKEFARTGLPNDGGTPERIQAKKGVRKLEQARPVWE